MSGTFNLSTVFWIWLISIFILRQKINSVSGWGFKTGLEPSPEPGNLKIPAFGRILHGIGSLYDGRTGNFLPPEFSIISGKTRLRLNPDVINRTKAYRHMFSHIPLYKPSQKLLIVYGEPAVVQVVEVIGNSMKSDFFFSNYDGLALRAVLGMLEFPENGTGGFLPDKITQEEMAETSPFYTSECFHTFQDALILPGAGKDQSPQEKLLRREIRRNLKRMDIKILKKATHVVVKVIRGSTTANSYADSASRWPVRVFSDTTLSPPPPEGVPLSFELMPLLQFLNESGLQLTPSSHQKFIGLEDSIWRNPMETLHGRTFKNLDWSWQLIQQMTKLNSTFHKCLEDNPRKNVKRGGEMIQDLENLYENFTQKFTTYKRELKNLLEKSSTGTEQDEKLWDSIYGRPYRAAGTGIYWNFYRDLDTAQQKVFVLGGENNNELYVFPEFYSIVNATEDTVKLGCDAIPEIA